MSASYPSSVKTFATRADGQTIGQSWFNDLQDEVHAVEDGLKNGLAHALKPSAAGGQDLGSASVPWGTGYFTGLPMDIGLCEGRLTLTSGTAVTTADVTAAGTLYFTPYKGNRVALYDGTNWALYTFTEKSLALTLTSGKPYDIWLYNNAGTLTLESLVWTNDTTRATALVLQDGVYVKTGATTRRYLGTIYASGANTTEDSFAKRYVWNYAQRRPRPMRVIEATNSWSYGTATVRQANAAAANTLQFVLGVAEDEVCLETRVILQNAAAFQTGIGIDTTTVIDTACTGVTMNGVAAASYIHGGSQLRKLIAEGRHAANWLENALAGSAVTTFSGNTPSSGISGVVWA